MGVSEQIIEVLDHLAQKFGVVIDWGQQSVTPYIQQLFKKYIAWEINTSIVWMSVGIVFIAFGYALLKAAQKWHDTHKDKRDYDGMCTALFIIAAVACCITALVIAVIQAIDIIRCCTFPELQVFEYVRNIVAYTG